VSASMLFFSTLGKVWPTRQQRDIVMTADDTAADASANAVQWLRDRRRGIQIRWPVS